jgi:hypothetical protein
MSSAEGLGDTVASVAKFFGMDRVAEAVAKLAGAEGCGCEERRQYLNELFPYVSYERSFKVLKAFKSGDKEHQPYDVIKVTKKDDIHLTVIQLVRDEFLIEI